jgi:sialate O-acetylesterase
MKSTPVLLTLLLSTSLLHAEVKLSKVFTPHMVLQRDMNAPIWGTAAPNEEVVVEFAGQKKTTKAGADGKWSVKLDPMPASTESRTLTIGGIKIDDVLVGDVWIGSGQSNMDMVVASYTKDDPVLDAASKQSYPLLRLMRKDAGATWQLSTPENNVKMSALLFSFGFALQKKIGVPAGIMVGAVGGTSSGFWLSEEMYSWSDAFQGANLFNRDGFPAQPFRTDDW